MSRITEKTGPLAEVRREPAKHAKRREIRVPFAGCRVVAGAWERAWEACGRGALAFLLCLAALAAGAQTSEVHDVALGGATFRLTLAVSNRLDNIGNTSVWAYAEVAVETNAAFERVCALDLPYKGPPTDTELAIAGLVAMDLFGPVVVTNFPDPIRSEQFTTNARVIERFDDPLIADKAARLFDRYRREYAASTNAPGFP